MVSENALKKDKKDREREARTPLGGGDRRAG